MRPIVLVFVAGILFDCQWLHPAAPSESHFAFSTLLRPGQQAPETGGGVFDQIGHFAVNNRREIAFGARISGSRFPSGVFLLSDGAIKKIALNGEPAPYVGPQFSEDFSLARVAINDLGQVAFTSTIGDFADSTPLVGVFYFRADDVFPVAIFPPIAPGVPDYVTGVSLNNNWEIAFSKQSGVYLFSNDRVVSLVSSGEQAGGVGAFRSFSDAVMNSSGQIAFYADASEGAGGLYLYSEGKISSIMRRGESDPGVPGSSFDSFEFRLDDAGNVLFAGDRLVNVTPIGGAIYRRFGLYLYSEGHVSPLVIVGQQVPGQNAVLLCLEEFSLSRSGNVAFSEYSPGGTHVYLSSSEGFSAARDLLDGNPPDNAAQLNFAPVAVNDSGALVVGGTIFEPGDRFRNELFLGVPVTPDSIPPDDFDVPGVDGLPLHWSTVWTNSGTGDVSRYDSGGVDAYSGSSTLRLHVGPGGGSIFVLSDPAPIIPDRIYAIAAEMRYALPSDSDYVAFTVLQYDANGSEIAINELDGAARDNRWNWKEKAIWVRTLPSAASLRIRFGLMSTVEAYADVDALGN